MIEPTLDGMMLPEHIFETMHKCANGVRWKASVQRFEINTIRWAANINRQVLSMDYKPLGFRRFDIVERGKLRHIQSVHISERVVQKLLCNYALKPTVLPRLIYDNSASQKGKGTEFALKRLKEHLRWWFARHGKSGVSLIMDYHDFFGSIPHEGTIEVMSKGLKDENLRYYTRMFIDAFDGDKGLGLGSETSQLGAILYPNPIDRLFKEKYKVHCYGRYMDDSYALFADRKEAETAFAEAKELAKRIGIEINDKKTHIHNLASDDFEYLKKRIRIEKSGRIVMRLTRANIRNERKRILEMKAEYDAGRMPISSIMQSYQSWRGYAKSYNAYHTVGQMDKFYWSVMGDILNEKCSGL